MPKRPRQSHLPLQPRKRRVRRNPDAAAVTARGGVRAEDDADAPVFADEPLITNPIAGRAPVDTSRPGRRLQAARSSREGTPRVSPGQLPTFGRGFLVRELKQIGVISSSLLGLIILLTLLLR